MIENLEQFVLPGNQLTEALRTFFVEDSSEVYLPIEAFDQTPQGKLCLIYDNIGFVNHAGHVYAPAWWLAKSYPMEAWKIELMCHHALRLRAKV